MPADITHLGLATVFQTLMFIMAEHRVCFPVLCLCLFFLFLLVLDVNYARVCRVSIFCLRCCFVFAFILLSVRFCFSLQ